MKCSIILKCDFTLACACVSFSSLSSARANCLLYISEPPSPQAFAAIIWFHSMGFAGKMALLGTAEMTLPAGNLSRASSFCIWSLLVSLFASHNMNSLYQYTEYVQVFIHAAATYCVHVWPTLTIKGQVEFLSFQLNEPLRKAWETPVLSLMYRDLDTPERALLAGEFPSALFSHGACTVNRPVYLKSWLTWETEPLSLSATLC